MGKIIDPQHQTVNIWTPGLERALWYKGYKPFPLGESTEWALWEGAEIFDSRKDSPLSYDFFAFHLSGKEKTNCVLSGDSDLDAIVGNLEEIEDRLHMRPRDPFSSAFALVMLPFFFTVGTLGFNHGKTFELIHQELTRHLYTYFTAPYEQPPSPFTTLLFTWLFFATLCGVAGAILGSKINKNYRLEVPDGFYFFGEDAIDKLLGNSKIALKLYQGQSAGLIEQMIDTSIEMQKYIAKCKHLQNPTQPDLTSKIMYFEERFSNAARRLSWLVPAHGYETPYLFSEEGARKLCTMIEQNPKRSLKLMEQEFERSYVLIHRYLDTFG